MTNEAGGDEPDGGGVPDIKENSMAKKQEVLDEQQLKRELHEKTKTCKYLQTQLKKAEAKPPQKDPVALHELDAAKKRIAELERNHEIQRKQIEGYKEQLDPKDDLELRYQGVAVVAVSRAGEIQSLGAAVDVIQLSEMMVQVAHILAGGAAQQEPEGADAYEQLMRVVLCQVAGHPIWRKAVMSAADRCAAEEWADDDD